MSNPNNSMKICEPNEAGHDASDHHRIIIGHDAPDHHPYEALLLTQTQKDWRDSKCALEKAARVFRRLLKVTSLSPSLHICHHSVGK